jgi:hypothetical protein
MTCRAVSAEHCDGVGQHSTFRRRNCRITRREEGQ